MGFVVWLELEGPYACVLGFEPVVSFRSVHIGHGKGPPSPSRGGGVAKPTMALLSLESSWRGSFDPDIPRGLGVRLTARQPNRFASRRGETTRSLCASRRPVVTCSLTGFHPPVLPPHGAEDAPVPLTARSVSPVSHGDSPTRSPRTSRRLIPQVPLTASDTTVYPHGSSGSTSRISCSPHGDYQLSHKLLGKTDPLSKGHQCPLFNPNVEERLDGQEFKFDPPPQFLTIAHQVVTPKGITTVDKVSVKRRPA